MDVLCGLNWIKLGMQGVTSVGGTAQKIKKNNKMQGVNFGGVKQYTRLLFQLWCRTYALITTRASA